MRVHTEQYVKTIAVNSATCRAIMSTKITRLGFIFVFFFFFFFFFFCLGCFFFFFPLFLFCFVNCSVWEEGKETEDSREEEVEICVVLSGW